MDQTPERNPNEGLVKIRLPLLGAARESGFEFESVWAEPLGGNQYRIWNVPVFSYNVEMRAVVECNAAPDGGFPIASRILQQGDCLGIRLYFMQSATDDQINEVLELLSARRALFEKYNERLWAVGVRTPDDYRWVGAALDSYVKQGILKFESVQQDDQPSIGGAV
jgi:hypothetical protein